MDKTAISLKYWLLGKNYYLAAKALEFAKSYHTGMRKDNVTPEILHPITVTNFCRTLHDGLLLPEETLAASLLHDVVEDYPVTIQEIKNRFGREVGIATELLSKVINGKKKSNEHYYGELATSPSASVVKGSDRVHNIQTMIGVFSQEKQKAYIKECEDFTLPMLKIARLSFPEQEPIYENIKLVLQSQNSLIKELHK